MSEPFGVRGRVLGEDGQPLAGARVILGPELRSVETDAGGRFAFDLLTGQHGVSARAGDFYSSVVQVKTEENVELRMRRGTTFVATVLADGRPLAGAIVALTRVLRTVTDERGIATLRGVPPDSFSGRVAAEGFATHNLNVAIFERVDVLEETIELVPGAEISGRVIDQSGAPVRHARVTLAGESREVSSETEPNADGTWKVAVRAGRYQITAAASPRTRRASQTVTLDCDGKTPQRDIVLQIATTVEGVTYGRIAGTVVDEQGRPADGARVRVARQKEPGKGAFLYEWFGETDSNGRFETDEIGATGELEVVTSWSARTEIRARAAVGDLDVKLVLPSGATLVGRAMIGGAPVPYFGVHLHKPGSRPMMNEITGVRAEDGRFAVPHVPPGTWEVAIRAPGTALAQTTAVTVTENELIELGDVELVPGHRISGFVRDRSGAPVADARVLVGRFGTMKVGVHAPWSSLEMLFLNHHETQTDASGFYALDGLDANYMEGFPEIVQATHPTAGLSMVCELPKADATFDFTLLGRGRIEGDAPKGGSPVVIGVGEPPLPRHVFCRGERFAIDVAPSDYEIWRHFADKQPATTVTVLDSQTTTLNLTPK